MHFFPKRPKFSKILQQMILKCDNPINRKNFPIISFLKKLIAV